MYAAQLRPCRAFAACPPAVLPPCCSSESPPLHLPIHSICPGPNGEQWCWWQCTVKGGREGRDVDAVQLAQVRQVAPVWQVKRDLQRPCSLPCKAPSARDAPCMGGNNHVRSPPPPPPPPPGHRRLRTWGRARSCSTASTATAWARALTSSWWPRCRVRSRGAGGAGGWCCREAPPAGLHMAGAAAAATVNIGR